MILSTSSSNSLRACLMMFQMDSTITSDMNKKSFMSKKIPSKIDYLLNNSNKLKKPGNLKWNPILTTSLFHMFGKSTKTSFGEKIKFMRLGFPSFLKYLDYFGMQKKILSNKFHCNLETFLKFPKPFSKFSLGHSHYKLLSELTTINKSLKTFGIKSLRTIMQKMNNGSMLSGAIFMSIMIPKLLEKFSTLLTTPNTTKEKSRR